MWKRLDIEDLKKILSDDETLKIQEISTESPDVIQDVLDIIADTWRGSWLGKSYEVDIRDHYVAPEYTYWILVHARYAIWTRFPMSPAIALDEARKEEYKKALEILKNPYISTSKPDYSDDPEAEKKAEESKRVDSSMGVQFQRFGSTWYMSGSNVKRIW